MTLATAAVGKATTTAQTAASNMQTVENGASAIALDNMTSSAARTATWLGGINQMQSALQNLDIARVNATFASAKNINY